jgi:hypothetical protein
MEQRVSSLQNFVYPIERIYNQKTTTLCLFSLKKAKDPSIYDLISVHLVHAAIIVINEAIDHGNAKETFEALRNPNAHLTDLDVNSTDEYQDLLYKAKGSKCQTALLRVSHEL